MDHTEVDQIFDDEGDSPLHLLAEQGVMQVLEHNSVDKVYNKSGMTPFGVLIMRHQNEIHEVLSSKYEMPIENNPNALAEVIRMPNSIKFLLGG